jgi:dTDP-glucose 4,6-dehydratase
MTNVPFLDFFGPMKMLVTGGAGFIGSAFVREALREGHRIVVLDALTYAGHLENLSDVLDPNRCVFVQGDIRDSEVVRGLLSSEKIDAVVHFAAESHVDNSILGPLPFLETNVLGTFQLLEACRDYFRGLTEEAQKKFRFVQVSTDEVYGSLGNSGFFTEESPYQPNSPYSASKAAADHLARAWFHTYGLPTITTNCSNNYGPRQFPEKLIPVMIQSCLSGKRLPVYGDGKNVRDWIHVEDHSRGVLLALSRGRPGQTYCFGGNSERTNLQVVEKICDLMGEKKKASTSYRQLISFVSDRPGHDWRYAINDRKAREELGFHRKYENFEQGLSDTIDWYLANQHWVEAVKSKRKS